MSLNALHPWPYSDHYSPGPLVSLNTLHPWPYSDHYSPDLFVSLVTLALLRSLQSSLVSLITIDYLELLANILMLTVN